MAGNWPVAAGRVYCYLKNLKENKRNINCFQITCIYENDLYHFGENVHAEVYDKRIMYVSYSHLFNTSVILHS